MCVFGGQQLSMSYSVGLFETLGHPEIVMFGLSLHTMHAVINDIGRRVRAGETMNDGKVLDDLFEVYPSMFRSVARRWYDTFLPWAVWYHGHPDFPALQCFWPDRSSRWPWEAAFDPSLARFQPLLFHEKASKASVVPLLAAMKRQPGHDS